MNSWKKMIAAIGGIGLAVAVGALIPRRSEAQYTSPVRVYNTTPQAIPVVTSPGGTPFVALSGFDIFTGGTTGSATPILASATHGVVLEQLSWLGAVSTGQALAAEVECTSAGATSRAYIPIAKFAADAHIAGQDRVSALIPLRMYCDANSNIYVSAFRSAATDANTFNYGQNFSLTGYLLP